MLQVRKIGSWLFSSDDEVSKEFCWCHVENNILKNGLRVFPYGNITRQNRAQNETLDHNSNRDDNSYGKDKSIF